MAKREKADRGGEKKNFQHFSRVGKVYSGTQRTYKSALQMIPDQEASRIDELSKRAPNITKDPKRTSKANIKQIWASYDKIVNSPDIL